MHHVFRVMDPDCRIIVLGGRHKHAGAKSWPKLRERDYY